MTTKYKLSYLSRKVNLFMDQVKSVNSGQFDGKAQVLTYMDAGLKHYELLYNLRKETLARRDQKNKGRLNVVKVKKS